MKKIATVIIALLFCGNALFSQKIYDNSIGAVVGLLEGVSYKGFVTEHFAIQADAGYSIWNYYVGGSLKINPNFMYEQEIKNGWFWFAGGGVNFGWSVWRDYYWDGVKEHTMRDSYYHPVYFGINAIGGAEYKFARIPLTLQADIRPGVFFYTRRYNPVTAPETVKKELLPSFDFSLIQLSARYTF